MLVVGGRQRGSNPSAVNPSRRGSRSSVATTHNPTVVRVRFRRERGGWGEIGAWGDEREGDAAIDVGEDAARGRGRSSSTVVVSRRWWIGLEKWGEDRTSGRGGDECGK